MEFTVCRDFAALRFIRVLAPIQAGGEVFAGGAAFTLPTALARCRSEIVERQFELYELAPQGIKPVGIAVHPDCYQKALKAAFYEALEATVIEHVVRRSEFRGRRLLKLSHLEWLYAPFAPGVEGYFSLLVGHRPDGARIVAYSARPTLMGTLLKTWEEFRNPFFHNVSPEDLLTYSKSGVLQGFSNRALRIEPLYDVIPVPPLTHFEIRHEMRQSHHVVYLVRKENRK